MIITASCQIAGIALSKRGTVNSDKLTVWNGDESLIRVTVSNNFSVHLSKEKLFDQSSNTDNWNEPRLPILPEAPPPKYPGDKPVDGCYNDIMLWEKVARMFVQY